MGVLLEVIEDHLVFTLDDFVLFQFLFSDLAAPPLFLILFMLLKDIHDVCLPFDYFFVFWETVTHNLNLYLCKVFILQFLQLHLFLVWQIILIFNLHDRINIIFVQNACPFASVLSSLRQIMLLFLLNFLFLLRLLFCWGLSQLFFQKWLLIFIGDHECLHDFYDAV